jgi:DNA-binding LytR/AlgR family response regulator
LYDFSLPRIFCPKCGYQRSKKELQGIAVPSMKGLLFVETGNITYLEANSNYTCFYLVNNQKITVTKTLKDFEDLLPAYVFIRYPIPTLSTRTWWKDI